MMSWVSKSWILKKHPKKSLVIILGAITIGFAYLALYLPSGIVELSLSLTNIVGGPIFGLFCIGFMIPIVDHVGALCGLLGTVFCSQLEGTSKIYHEYAVF